MTDQELALQQKLHDSLTALAHKHATVSYALIGVLVLVLAVMGAGGYVAVKFADAQIARAEKAEQAFDAAKKESVAQLVAGVKQRTQAKVQETTLEAQRETGDAKAGKAVEKALDPNASQDAIQQGLSDAYINDALFQQPLPVSGGLFQATPPQIQRFTATKIERDQYAGDVVNLTKQFESASGRADSLQADLNTEIGLEDKCEKAKQDWEKAAKVGKFKRFLGGALKVGLFVGGVYLGSKL